MGCKTECQCPVPFQGVHYQQHNADHSPPFSGEGEKRKELHLPGAETMSSIYRLRKWLQSRGFQPWRSKRFLWPSKLPDRLWGHGHWGSFPWVKQTGLQLTTHLQLLPRWRKSGTTHMLTLHAFMAWSGKTLAVRVMFPFPTCLDGVVGHEVQWPFYF